MDISQYQRGIAAMESAGGRLVSTQQRQDAAVKQTSAVLQRHGQVGQRAFNTINTAMMATGQELGPVGSAFSGLGLIWTQMDGQGTRLARTFQAVGAAAIVVGGLITAQSAREQSAVAQLKNAVTDTGKSWDDYSGQLEAAAAAQAHFGSSKASALQALATLTRASQDPAQAIKDIGLAQDFAAAKGITLTEAADTLAKVYGGSTRALKQFGINVKDLVNPQAELTKATRDQQTAATAMSTAQQHLADVEQRTAAARQQAEQNYTDAVQRAQDKVAASSQTLGDARQRLADIEDQIHQRTQLTVSDQYQLIQAQQDVSDTQNRIASGALTGQDAFIAQRDAAQRLAEVHATQAEKTRLSTSETHQLRNAHTAVTRATTAHAAAVSDLNGTRAAGVKAIPLGLRQEEAAAERAFKAAQGKVKTANAEMGKARKDMAEFPVRVQQVLAEVQKRVAGAGEAQAHTFTGTLKRILAESENWVAQFGTKWGGAVTAAGVGLTLFTTLVQVRSLGAIRALAGVAGAEAGVGAASEGMSLAALGPIGAIVAAVVVLGVAAYELYKHWDKVWGWIVHHKAYAALIAMLFPITVPLVAIVGTIHYLKKHWDTVWADIRAVASFTAGFLSKVFITPINVIIDAVNWLIHGLNKIHFSTPSWIPGWAGGGKSFGIHIDDIPPLGQKAAPAAVGGVASVGMLYATVPVRASQFQNPTPPTKGTAGGFRSFDVGGRVPGPFGVPQLIVAHGGEHVTSLADEMSGRTGGAQVHVHLEGAVITDQASLNRLGAVITDAVHDGLLRKKRRGTPLRLT